MKRVYLYAMLYKKIIKSQQISPFVFALNF